jgi:hypothetical protein
VTEDDTGRTRSWLFFGLLALYLITGGGKGYSIDGAFGYEMAKTVFLDPEHVYFSRFKTAFARWGALQPLLGQPLVLFGDALGRAAPERDAVVVDGHAFRVEEWPPVAPGVIRAAPVPEGSVTGADALALLSFLANGAAVPQGAQVAEVRLWSDDRLLATLPIRAGVETAEWAYDRPDVYGNVQHRRARVGGQWVGQPRGNLYYATLALPPGARVTRWELRGVAVPEAPDAQWHVRAAAFRQAGAWRDAHTGERFWSPRQTRDFFTRLVYASLNGFTTAASAVLVYAILTQLGFDPTTRLGTTLAYGTLTMAWPYAKLDFSEPASTLFVLVAVWAYLVGFAPARSSAPHARAALRLGIVAAVGLLLAVVGKYTAALGAVALAMTWLLTSRWWRPDWRRPALAFIAATALPAALLGLGGVAAMALFAGETPVVFRNALERAREDWLALPLWTGLRGLLLSPGKSLFLYSPWLALALPGGALLWRRLGRVAALFTLYPAVVVLLYSMKLVWHGGGWGPRYLLPVVPFLAIAAAPAVSWCQSRIRGRAALAALAIVSLGVQLLGVAKDPETFPEMVREHVVRALPDFGSRLGGRDYWEARGGAGIARALVDPTAPGGRRGLGYVWGFPTAEIQLVLAEERSRDLSAFFVDWDRQQRRQRVTLEDAAGRRDWDIDRDFGDGVWATWRVSGGPASPIRLSLEQRGADTAVVSALVFDAPRTDRAAVPVLDAATRGDWVGRYGRDGYALFAWHSFNVDLAERPSYVSRIEVSHVGDKPDPRIHVETAEQDLLDTPLLYAAPFSPLLGNAWLLTADAAHLALPQRPDVAAALLSRPPWTWAGIAAPRIEHPEYGLGLDFWPTLLYTNYASHRPLLYVAAGVLIGLEAVLLAAVAALAGPAVRAPALLVTSLALAGFDWLQIAA